MESMESFHLLLLHQRTHQNRKRNNTAGRPPICWRFLGVEKFRTLPALSIDMARTMPTSIRRIFCQAVLVLMASRTVVADFDTNTVTLAMAELSHVSFFGHPKPLNQMPARAASPAWFAG